MIRFSPCKINLGLYVTEKRSDGYHQINSLFYPVPLFDILELIEDSERPHVNWTFTSSGLPIPGQADSNLVVKAYRILAEKFSLPAVKIHLHKVIPMGAGLGGGSSDAANMLRLLNQKFDLDLEQANLMNYASRLGSDCPFFILDSPALAGGRGEVLHPLPDFLLGYWLYLVHPGIHISTKEAFEMIVPRIRDIDLMKIAINHPVTWRKNLNNDFEAPVCSIYPEIGDIRDKLYGNGAIYASMSGSGSAVYGIFKDEPERLDWPEHYFKAILRL